MNSKRKVEVFVTVMILVGVLPTKMIVSTFTGCPVITFNWFYGDDSLFLVLPLCCGADTNAALHYYKEENVVTTNGVLNITVERKVNRYKAYDEVKKFFYPDQKYIQSGMVQSWNKFCFIGGIVEFSAKLPGDPHKGGLWPARKLLINQVLEDRGLPRHI